MTAELPTITDAEMQTIQEYAQPYTVVILRAGPNFTSPEAADVVREHGRRAFSLRAAGVLAVVTPVVDDSEVFGFGTFDRDPVEVESLMADDPAVKAGVLVAEIHPVIGLPGDSLPPRSVD